MNMKLPALTGRSALSVTGGEIAPTRGLAVPDIGHLLVAAVALWLLGAPSASAAELVIFEAKGCPYCRVWDEQIGEIYPRSDLGEIAPLRRVDIDDPWPEDLSGVGGIVFTPTFVLIDDGAEIGRITGYIGEFQFWGLLQRMIAGLHARRQTLPLSPAAYP